MRWMEFIKVQNARAHVAEILMRFVKESRTCQGLLEAKVFRHAKVGDCSLCLFWKTRRPELLGSSVGLHLSNTLKKYGLVDHSVWVEKDEDEERKP